MQIKINGVDQTGYYLSGRVKFDRPEGAIGHTESILDFHKAVTVSRKDELEITKDGKTMYLIVEKITNTKNTNQKRIVAKDYIYFKKDMPLPAVVFVNVHLSDVCAWFVSQEIFDAYSIVPSGYVDPVVPFYFIEEDTKLSEVLKDIAESVQGRVFTDVTDPVYKGKKIRFQFASLKTYTDTPLMAITEDQWEGHEISDLPRQHNAFTLKFKKKTQIQDSLVFRGASYEDTYEVPNGGYPTGDDQYFAEFENPVIAVTDHSFDSYEVVIEQDTWRSNILVPDSSNANYGTLKDPFKMKLKFLCNSAIGGTIYDFRIYGTAIKQDDMAETIDISGDDFKKEKEISSDLISTDSDWHKKTIAWLASKKVEKQTLTIVDPSVNFVDMMAVNAGPLNNLDNTIVDVDGIKVDVDSATWTFEKNTWNLSGYTARDPGTVFSYIEKMKSGDVLDTMQKRLVTSFEKKHPNPDAPDDTIQLIELPIVEKIENYNVEIEPIYMKGTSNTAKYIVFNKQRSQFEFEAYAGEPPEFISDIGIVLADSVLADHPAFGSFSRIFYPNPADVTIDAGNDRLFGGFTVKFYRKSDDGYVGEYSDTLSGSWVAFRCAFALSSGDATSAQLAATYPGSNIAYGSPQMINSEVGYNASELYAVMDSMVLQPVNYEPLQGRFRFKIFQDLNQRLSSGILSSIPSQSSSGSSPRTFNVQTVADGSTPAFESTSYTTYETYTKVDFKTSSGATMKTAVIRKNDESSYIEAVAYRYSTYDNYKYFDYRYENGSCKTIKFYDPDNLIADVVTSPK